MRLVRLVFAAALLGCAAAAQATTVVIFVEPMTIGALCAGARHQGARPGLHVHGPAGDRRLHRRHQANPPLGDRLQQPFEQPPAVGAAVGRLDRPLGVRHHAEHIAGVVEDPGDAAAPSR